MRSSSTRRSWRSASAASAASPAEEVAALARDTLAEAGLAAGAVAAIVSIDLKADEPAIHALADALGVPARFFPAPRLLAEETERLTIRSEAAFRATGCWGVAEGAALAAAGPDGALVVPQAASRGARPAPIARAATPIDAGAIGRPRGRLAIVGIGPGDPAWRTPEAQRAACGGRRDRRLRPLSRPARPSDRRQAPARQRDRRRGGARPRLALDLAAEGRSVALVSSGDPGIYALAALVFELLDRERRRDWSAVEIAVAPGCQRDAGRGGARRRAARPRFLRHLAVRPADPVAGDPRPPAKPRRAPISSSRSYNPRSARRRRQLGRGGAICCWRTPARRRPCVIARNLGRAGETLSKSCRLDELAGSDQSTC